MEFIQVTIECNDASTKEILTALLGEIAYEGFEETEDTLIAYVEATEYDDEKLEKLLFSFQNKYTSTKIAKQNWNSLWESNFQPVIIDDFVSIRAHFHEPILTTTHEIVITPKMSFGTGHHATTNMVMRLMKDIVFKEKTVVDFGTGTGILAILAEKLGAKAITAIDNDDWCIENAQENIIQNNCSHIHLLQKETAQTDTYFDVIIANINKNIILENLKHLVDNTKLGTTILLSGLLLEDEQDILKETNRNSWKHIQTIESGAWIALEFLS